MNTDGRGEVLGTAVDPSEAEVFWKSFLCLLGDRGLHVIRFVVADGHKGLRATTTKVFHAAFQRCRVHWMCDALTHVGPKQRPPIVASF